MHFVDRSLAWMYVRHTLIAPATFIMLIMCVIASFAYYKVGSVIPKWIPMIIVGIPFIILDVIYNVVFGSFVFLEFPREWLYTKRIVRHRNSPYSGPREFSHFMCRILDHWDPGHCNNNAD